MDVYLPIAEMSVNLAVMLGLGTIVGFLSGMFGVGGGFVMTPLLIFFGIPPAIAVGSQGPQILASSFSSMLGHLRRGTLDLRMGAVLAAGGLVGSAAGILIFRLLRELGQIDAAIALGYVLFLSTVGLLMLVESLRAIAGRRRGVRRARARRHYWLHRLPLRMRFPTSRLYISALTPLAIGFLGGLLAAIFGIGGGFVLIPAMIYLIGMPTSVVIGTSHFQIAFVAVLTTLLHAYANRTVDIVLAILVIAGGVVGAQYGTRAATRLPAEQVRVLFALMLLAVCGKLVYDLILPPADRYSLASF